MNFLISITNAVGLEDNLATHEIHVLPVVVISPHNQCNCRCVMCDIWRIREPKEIHVEDLERHLDSFRKLGVRWVVFSGGEPQMNSQLPHLAGMLRSEGIRVTILTAGLLLQAQAEVIAASVDDVILSLDGPPAIHDKIRRVAGAFELIAAGVEKLRQIRPAMIVGARCTVQKMNHTALRLTAQSAREIGLNSISFLAADLASKAFNRPESWPPERQGTVALDAAQVEALDAEVEHLIEERREDPGFVVETDSKLRRIVLHFRAHLGQVQDSAPRCNAPWVSAVIDASGDVRPCFFHAPLGNMHTKGFAEILNSSEALRFRAKLDIASDPICRHCVCSLHIPR
jgi:Fe-coproporphyrin III synthase